MTLQVPRVAVPVPVGAARGSDGASVRCFALSSGDGCFDVVHGDRGEAQLRPPESVNMVIYSDGIQLHNLKFCKYEEKVCRSMVEDVMDGAASHLLGVLGIPTPERAVEHSSGCGQPVCCQATSRPPSGTSSQTEFR